MSDDITSGGSDNGGPLCKRHNLRKNQGDRVHRDGQGRWHTYRPDGSEIC